METRSVSEEFIGCASLTHRVTLASPSVFRKVTINASPDSLAGLGRIRSGSRLIRFRPSQERLGRGRRRRVRSASGRFGVLLSYSTQWIRTKRTDQRSEVLLRLNAIELRIGVSLPFIEAESTRDILTTGTGPIGR